MSAVIDLCSDTEDDRGAPLPPAAPSLPIQGGGSGSGAHFFQLRDGQNPERSWAISLREMLEPSASVTHVLLSTFGHASDHVDQFRATLKSLCPRLEEMCIVSDWQNTGGIGGSAAGQIAPSMLPEGISSNPYYFVPDYPPDGIHYSFIFPRLGDEVVKESGNKGRYSHSIQHVKLLMVRHAAGAGSPAHLRVHIMSCNIDNVASMKNGAGDIVWRSPELPALPTRDLALVLPTSPAARRFGHPLFKMVHGFLEPALEKLGRCGSQLETRRVREWADMLAGYALDAVPDRVSLCFSMPGYFPTRVVRPLAAGELGQLGGRLKCWEYDAEMARNLALVLGLRFRTLQMEENQPSYTFKAMVTADGRLHPLIELWPEPENEDDPHALLVMLKLPVANFVPKRLGRLSRRDAGGLSPLLTAGVVTSEATLHVVVGSGKAADQSKPLAEGMMRLPDVLIGTRWYIDVVVSRVGAEPLLSAAPAASWLDLAGQLRCNLGISRLREVLHSTGPWPLSERRAFVSMSASVGHTGIISFARSFASACDGTVDIDAFDKALLQRKVREHGLSEPEPLPCKQQHAACRAGTCHHKTGATVDQLRQVLRPIYQPGSVLPSLILPTGHAPGALMGNLKAFRELEAAHEQSGYVLNDLSLASGASVHPRLQGEVSFPLAARVTHAHSKIAVGFYEEPGGGRFGWAYVGSHNFSPTSWGSPMSIGMSEEEALGLVQHSNWECGVVLTVPRGASQAEVRRSMSFDAWPLPFDPMRLRPYRQAELQRACDAFAMVPALQAKARGEPSWQSLVPQDVRQRAMEDELAEDIARAFGLAEHAGGGSEFGFEVESGDDEDPLGVAMLESLHQWEREQDAALNAALAASLQEGGVARKAASGKRPADDSCR